MSAHLHVYGIDTRDAATLSQPFFCFIPASEWQRINTLKRPEDQINRKVAYAALYRLVHQMTGVPPEQINIVRSAQGKPFLRLPANVEPIHISLSHSGHCVVLALGPCPIGVDVEQIRPLDVSMFQRDYFPRDTLNSTDSLLSLLTLWTHKEACLKAVGTGLHLAPDLLVMHAPSCDFQPLSDWPKGHGFGEIRVAKLPMPEGYVAAIAALHASPQASMKYLDYAALQSLA
ncbi:4'-phosphopantetheinyl transferase superfamily protein [Alcaligenaceae bacterium]|nr:4'-phosphopantetheinyl transferase superfamily protein [Alcaligenaceae bacterium]